jgi:hypothetical protein
MLNMPTIYVPLLLAIVSLVGCSDSRRDPCQLLTVSDVKSVDNSVTVSLWAGRDGARKEDEVCAFYTADGDPRVMLFSWYEKQKAPMELAKMAAEESNGLVVDLPRVGLGAAAFFQGEDLKFLAVKSMQGVIGLRTKKDVKRDSPEFDQLVLLAGRALSRKQ